MASNYYPKLEESLWAATTDTLKDLGYTDILVRYASDDVLEPRYTYCVLNVLSIEQTGHTIASAYTEQSEGIVFPTHYRVLTQFSLVGDMALEIAPSLRQAIINNPISREHFINNGLGVGQRSGIRNIPYTTETGWKQSMNFDVHFNFMFLETQEADYVDNVVLEGVGETSETRQYFPKWLYP